jgi:hypothetical protein
MWDEIIEANKRFANVGQWKDRGMTVNNKYYIPVEDGNTLKWIRITVCNNSNHPWF